MSDRGHAGVELAMAIAVLLIPVAVVVLGFGPWSERRVSAEAVAAEAARAAVLELSQQSGDRVISASIADLGIAESQVRVGWCDASPGPLNAPAGACPMVRGSAVQVAVQLWVPLINTPWGPIGGLWVTASHSEPIDLYRSLR
jgi:Flp pilus assembly protein TadG